MSTPSIAERVAAGVPGRACSVDGCDRPAKARGMCKGHWTRWQRDGDPGPAEIRPVRRGDEARCSIEGCGRPYCARGYCKPHWARWKKNGDPGPAEVRPVSGRQTYTDDEMAVIADRSIPAEIAAEAIGVWPQTIYTIRKRIEFGTLKLRDWLESEVDFILESFETMTIEQTATFLGRPYRQVKTEVDRLRRNGVVPRKPAKSLNPCAVANRRLLAKTCPTCGLLLAGEWFRRDKKGCYQPSCKRCAADHINRLPDDDRTRRIKGTNQYQAKLQAITLERAENRGKEWTESDLQVLADPNKTSFQKALELKRTYFSVHNAAVKNGLTSKPDWEVMENAEWRLFWDFEPDEPAGEAS